MSDTIELLAAIGRNAALRYASTDKLSEALAHEKASVALMAAAASGDSSWLSEELGPKPTQAPQITQAPCHEDEDPEDDDDEDSPPPVLPGHGTALSQH